MIQAVSDPMLGWYSIRAFDGLEHDYYVRQLAGPQTIHPADGPRAAGTGGLRRQLRLDTRPCPCKVRGQDRHGRLLRRWTTGSTTPSRTSLRHTRTPTKPTSGLWPRRSPAAGSPSDPETRCNPAEGRTVSWAARSPVDHCPSRNRPFPTCLPWIWRGRATGSFRSMAWSRRWAPTPASPSRGCRGYASTWTRTSPRSGTGHWPPGLLAQDGRLNSAVIQLARTDLAPAADG